MLTHARALVESKMQFRLAKPERSCINDTPPRLLDRFFDTDF